MKPTSHLQQDVSAEFGEKTAREIDGVVRKIVVSSFEKATGILRQERDLLDRGAQMLLQKETLNEEDLSALRHAQPAAVGGRAQNTATRVSELSRTRRKRR